MTTIRTSVLAVVFFGAASANAEILVLPDGGYGVTSAAATAARGSSEGEVLQAFGEPEKRHAAVGVPAISSWQYESFRVYFEDGLVLHTVFSSQ